MLRSLRKAVALMDTFTLDAPEWALADLSRRVGIPKATVHHIMETLVEAGWVERNPENRRYRLGIRLWEKGWLAINQMGFPDQARPFVEKLMQVTGETVRVSILDAVDPGDVIYVDMIESGHAVRAYSVIGNRAPSHCVATGKAMLAFSPDAVRRVLGRPLKAYTSATITDPDRLLEELERTRARGYSVNTMEYRQDVVGVAAPIRNHEGRVFAAVGISGPAYRLPADVIERIAPAVVATGETISTTLGFVRQHEDAPGRQGPGRAPRRVSRR